MEIAHALEAWHEFYLLLGTGGGTLVALLFVAVSLGGGFLNEERALATRSFFSPVVIHFAMVFFLSCIALIPEHTSGFFAVLIGLSALAGLAVSGYATVQILRHDWTPYWFDRFAYGVLPVLGYVALLVAAWMCTREMKVATDVLAGALLLLLLVNIRNAWDLMLEMVRRRKE